MPKTTALIRDGSTGPLGTARRPALKQALLASAAVIALMGTHLGAQALALGAVTVRSALGEPLRAEIAIPQISSEEASSLEASVGTPEAFRAAGVDYNAALAGARVTVHRRRDGQAYLRVVGTRPVNEPFLGLVIEANWAAGKIVRDYTMLIDPAQHGPATSVVAAPAQAAPPQVRPAAAEQVTPQPASRPVTRRRAAPAPAPATAPAGGSQQVTVQRGDTASSIVRRHAVAGASLDQMLVALLRANPDAFIRGNVNLVKAGAVLQLPTAEQAQATSRANARRTVLAQSRDFQTYRRGLARAAPAADASTAAAGRSASGSVQAEVKETQAPPPPSDRLTISKAGAAGGTEAAAALSRQAQEQADRVAELSKNLSELERLQSAAANPAAAAPAATATSAPSGSGIEVAGSAGASASSTPMPGAAPETAPPAAGSDTAAETAAASAAATAAPAATTPAAGAPEPTAAGPSDAAGTPAASDATTQTPAPEAPAADAVASTPAAPASAEEEKPAPAPAAAAAPAAAPAAPPAPAPAAAPSFLDELMENPLLPVGGAALIALLVGLGLYRSRQRKKEAASIDSEFIESRMQPDSFFGASGGQRVNTQEAVSRTGVSSMSYSPSQLDAAGDVDPVAEADVYLAYGRDMQAEEILKEALLVHPRRFALHRKLAEIYAKRRDTGALAAIATQAFEATQGEGPEWQAIAALGAEIDPTNALYRPGGKPDPAGTPAPARRQFGADTEPQTASVILSKEPEGTTRSPLDLDLETADETRQSELTPLPMIDATDADQTPVVAATDAAAPGDSVDLDLGLDFTPPTQSPAPASAPAALSEAALGDSGMIDFDMSALAVDPDSRSGADVRTEQPDDADDDPLSTKLSLAQEFRSIGDVEGARSLAQEVVAEASGALKIKAERFLAEL